MTRDVRSMSLGLANSCLVGLALVLALSTTAVPWPDGTWGPRFGLFPAVIGMVAIGWLLTRRRPDNAVGWLLSIAASFAGSNLATLYGALFCRQMGWDAAGQWLGFVAEGSWIPAMAFVLLALSRFPHGDRVPGPSGRAIDTMAGVAMMSVSLAVFLAPGPMSNTQYPKPGFVPSVPASAEGVLGLLMLPWPLFAITVAWTLVSSYRRATGVARQQFRWVVYAGGTFLSSFVLIIPWTLGGPQAWWTAASISNSLLLGVLFTAIGAAILRYRLYDLDRIVSRSLTYLLLTAALVTVYAASILLLGGALRRMTGGDPETVVVAASTLLAVGLFEPLRQRFQRVIDRRLYRSRFDAQQAIQALGTQLADQLDDAALRHEIAGAVARTLAPSTVAVWEPEPAGHTRSHPVRRTEAEMNSLDTATHAPEAPTASGDDTRPSAPAPIGQLTRGRWRRRRRAARDVAGEQHIPTREVDAVPIAANDPLLVYLTAVRRPVDVDELGLSSPAADAMRAAGVRMLVPLVTSGELIGVIQLGERLSEQGYSADDRHLLEMLAAQAAPALRVGQLVQEQQTQVRVRERYEQELKVAQLIQQRFLPHDLPEPTGWRIHPYYLAAREVGGDFYDVLDLPDGKLGVVIGDVTDKGVPAALVMASTRSVLRAAAQRLVDPAAVLARVNDELVRDIPAKMFVTCLYGVLDPVTGSFRFANAGHDLPFLFDGELTELWATGMPLGMLSGATYDEVTVELAPGSRLLLYSDGLAEAHAPDGEMFGFPRVGEVVRDLCDRDDPIQEVVEALHAFTGASWQQEDDVTLLLVQRAQEPCPAMTAELLASFSVPSVPGGEREAIRQVMGALTPQLLAGERREALGMAVGEAVMNAMEHGNTYEPDMPVHVEVTALDDRLHVAVTDRGGGTGYLDTAEQPDIQAKLRGDQSPRGWGLFLVRSLVDDVHEAGDDDHHTLTLEMRLGGADDQA